MVGVALQRIFSTSTHFQYPTALKINKIHDYFLLLPAPEFAEGICEAILSEWPAMLNKIFQLKTETEIRLVSTSPLFLSSII